MVETAMPKSRQRSSPEMNLNLNVRRLGQSATLAINERCAELRREGREIYRFGLGQSPFPVPACVVEELRSHAHEKDYLAVKGLRDLRDAVANYHRMHDGIDCDGDDVMVGPGSKELMFILQLVYYGELVIPTPSWVSYAPQANIIGRTIHWVKTSFENSWRITPDQLETLCKADPQRPRLLILNYPDNPSGETYQSDELRELAKVARRYKVLILSDEIYGELHHRGQHVSMARYYPEGTIVSSGLSKWCGAGGWRLGTFTFPRQLHWLLDAMAVVASETYTSTSAPIQHAAVRAFEGGLEIERFLHQSRRILRALGQALYQGIEKSGARVVKPRGGFYLFPDLTPLAEPLRARGIQTSRELCDRLLEETGVAMLPGSDFGRPDDEFTVRMAYVDFDGARALVTAEGIPLDTRLDRTYLSTCCERVLKGCDLFCDWLGAV
jgi:aspartate aminotransferase